MAAEAHGSKVVAKVTVATKTAPTPMEQGPYVHSLTVEPATGIERATCGLRIPDHSKCSPPDLPLQQHDSNDIDDDDPQTGFE